MELLRRAPVGVMALIVACCMPSIDHAAGGPISFVVPGRSSANVSLASDGSFVAATWSASTAAGETDIYATTSRDGGRIFAPPTRVNSAAGDARVNAEQPPRAALTRVAGGAPRLTIVWTAKGTTGTRLLTAESRDGARSFAPSTTVPGTDVAGNRGWEAITSDSRGAVQIVWLDHRLLAKNDDAMATSHHEHSGGVAPRAMDGVAMAQLSQLYVATLNGATSPRGITGGVCYCCKTALAAGPGGALYAAWRHVYPGNLRDIAFASSSDGGGSFSAPLRVSEDKWQLEGCPDDGPAMAVDAGGRIHLVWPTLVTDNGEQTIGLFYAVSTDGRRFSHRQQIPTAGLAHHPQITTLANGRVLVAWDELTSGVRRVVLGRVAAGLQPRITREMVAGSESGTYPVVVRTPAGALLAWTSNQDARQTIRAQTIAIP